RVDCPAVETSPDPRIIQIKWIGHDPRCYNVLTGDAISADAARTLLEALGVCSVGASDPPMARRAFVRVENPPSNTGVLRDLRPSPFVPVELSLRYSLTDVPETTVPVEVFEHPFALPFLALHRS